MKELIPILAIFGTLMYYLIVPGLACDVNNYCVINQPENITIRVFNYTSGSLVTDGNCSIDIYHGADLVTNEATMTYDNSGIYFYTLNGEEINQTGLYTYYINVTKDTYYDFKSGSYEIANYTLLTKLDTVPFDVWTYTTRTITDFGNLVQAIWSYTSRVVTGIPRIIEQTDRYGQPYFVQTTETNCDERVGGCVDQR